MSGIFGIVSKEDCIEDLFYGTDYNFHLGTVFGGMAVIGDEAKREIHSISSHSFRSRFEDFVRGTQGNSGIGVISDYEEQPVRMCSHLGQYSLVHVGKITNLENLAEKFRSKGGHFSEMTGNRVNPTELVGAIINQGKNYLEGLEILQNTIEGSSSVMVLTMDGVYVSRDKLGRTPLVIGKKQNARAATSETCAFPNLGFSVEKFLGPGEIGIITENKYDMLKAQEDKMQICSFLWVYYGFPASDYEGVNVEEMRNRSGAIHGKIDEKEKLKIDFVAGIPDSGTGHAIGYANERRIPYKRPFVKYTPTWPRSFMPQVQDARELVARMKLITIKSFIEGNRLLFCEDSIVRGTQLKDTINRLYDECNAKEVHMRPACPPLLFSCDYLNFSSSKSDMQLAARRAIEEIDGKGADVYSYADESSEKYSRMVEKIRVNLRLSTLRYQKRRDMISAIGLSGEKLCTYCWDGCRSCK